MTRLTKAEELRKFYENGAYLIEDVKEEEINRLVSMYGAEGAECFLFSAELLYEICGLDENAVLPKDRLYLIVQPMKDYCTEGLETLACRIWTISESTGKNMFNK